MAGRIYTASFDAVAVTAAQDFFEITAASGTMVRILSAFIGQSSDFGDASAEMLRVQINRYATSGTAVGTPTARPHHVGDAAFGGTVESNNTVQGGTPTLMLAETFNVQAGWYYTPTPEEQMYSGVAGIIAISMPSTPADSLTMSGRVTFEVIG